MMIFIICVPFKRKTVNKLSRFFSSSLRSFSVSLLVVCVAQSTYNVISCLTLPMHFSAALKFPARLRWRSRKLHHFRPRCELRTSRIVQSAVALILYVHELSCKLLNRSSFSPFSSRHGLYKLNYCWPVLCVVFVWVIDNKNVQFHRLFTRFTVSKKYSSASTNLLLTWIFFQRDVIFPTQSPLFMSSMVCLYV